MRTKETSFFIPLRHVFRLFLEQEGVLRTTLDYMEKLKTEHVIIENVIQGQCWKNATKGKDGIILPLFLDNDDIEVGNVLGGHAGVNKINATCCSLPCLPPDMRSSLNHIFLALLTKSSNFKRFGNSQIFKPIIKELRFLSKEGIIVTLDGQIVKVFFQLSILIGDNLGLNSIAGFTQNFSTSHYCCRICSANKRQRQT